MKGVAKQNLLCKLSNLRQTKTGEVMEEQIPFDKLVKIYRKIKAG
jgi:hypothetical protein